MKKKMLTVVMVIIGVIALVLIGWYVMFMNFGIGPVFPFVKAQPMDFNSVGQSAELATIAEDSLMASVETEEEARTIAEQYGIELVTFENRIALYHTEENPFDVIARGQENGYPQLSINFVRTGYDAGKTQ